jgi:hypothetical protein
MRKPALTSLILAAVLLLAWPLLAQPAERETYTLPGGYSVQAPADLQAGAQAGTLIGTPYSFTLYTPDDIIRLLDASAPQQIGPLLLALLERIGEQALADTLFTLRVDGFDAAAASLQADASAAAYAFLIEAEAMPAGYTLVTVHSSTPEAASQALLTARDVALSLRNDPNAPQSTAMAASATSTPGNRPPPSVPDSSTFTPTPGARPSAPIGAGSAPIGAESDLLDALRMASAEERCVAFTNERDSVLLRTGPGFNRTAFIFMPAGSRLPVVGSATTERGRWYRVVGIDADLTTLWVPAEAINTSGPCADLPVLVPPPVLPDIAPGDPNGGRPDFLFIRGVYAHQAAATLTVTCDNGARLRVNAAALAALGLDGLQRARYGRSADGARMSVLEPSIGRVPFVPGLGYQVPLQVSPDAVPGFVAGLLTLSPTAPDALAGRYAYERMLPLNGETRCIFEAGVGAPLLEADAS